jgi:15-cis-phytoene synthase
MNMLATTKEAYDYCVALTERRESNFSIGFSFLTSPKKKAITAVYAFCRYVDDIADQGDVSDIMRYLDKWKSELESIYQKGESQHPIGIALLDVLKSVRIPKDGFEDLIRGCQQDQKKKRYKDFGELEEYCDLVATSIAKVSFPVYGVERYDEAFTHGRSLSLAFQLTNILRDIPEDFERGRCYLPDDHLRQFELKPEDFVQRTHEKRLTECMQLLANRCENFYHEGEKVQDFLHEDSRRCVAVMTETYHTLLRKITRNPLKALELKTVLTHEEKERIIKNGS